MRSFMRRVVVVATAVALMLGGGTAFAADNQSANFGNSGSADRGESGQGEAGPALGPHNHCVLPAFDNGHEIISAAAHQAHDTIGLSGPIFVVNCPSDPE